MRKVWLLYVTNATVLLFSAATSSVQNQDASWQAQLTYAVKKIYCQEATDRFGKGRYCNKEGLRICSKHAFEINKKRIEVICAWGPFLFAGH